MMQPLGENTINTPAFLGKLWKMVNDPSTDNLICWSPSGNSFVIQNQAQFWYKLLPLHYKHNNMSSFVRQLNMYGFHKLSTVENGTMDTDKDEIQFTHPFFLKDQPELLKNIKRKAATSKSSIEPTYKHDELVRVVTDVKQLRGRQANVDHQLNAMKEENALLWREVAILRQKHLKQQKIVNKLIQFLVTLVQPSRMPVGVKRGYQLMLHENPNKKTKTGNSNKISSNTEGPTIHELDNELDLAPNIYNEDPSMINSPTASVGSQHGDLNSPLQSQITSEDHGEENSWDKPEYVTITRTEATDDLIAEADLNQEELMDSLENESTAGNNVNNRTVFLNPATQDTLLSNLMKNNFSDKAISEEDKTDGNTADVADKSLPLPPSPEANTNMAIATRDNNLCDVIKNLPSTSDVYAADLSKHIESTQNELNQVKDLLNGYNSIVDANALLGLFNGGESPVYSLDMDDDKNENLIDTDPLVSGGELTPYETNFDFTELFDDSLDGDNAAVIPTTEINSSTINTPQIITEAPIFPAMRNEEK